MNFRTSSYSVNDGACIEIGQKWRKSSHSAIEECVEVAPGVLVRDSKNKTGNVLNFTPETWTALLAGVK